MIKRSDCLCQKGAAQHEGEFICWARSRKSLASWSNATKLWTHGRIAQRRESRAGLWRAKEKTVRESEKLLNLLNANHPAGGFYFFSRYSLIKGQLISRHDGALTHAQTLRKNAGGGGGGLVHRRLLVEKGSKLELSSNTHKHIYAQPHARTHLDLSWRE